MAFKGVAGGTASGKTTVCDMIIAQLRDQRVVLVNQDSFYCTLTDEQLKSVHEHNFDHPDAFDTELLLNCMETLKRGQAVSLPNYDFKAHERSGTARQVNPSGVIILEGILVLHDPRVRNLMNMKIFVDTDSDLRLARRIQRDTVERGRDIRSVLDQYAKFVKPGFEEFILPSKKFADIIIPRGGDNIVAIDLIAGDNSNSGESMENALRACCKGIKIGKILIHGDQNNDRQLIYEKLPSDISGRHVLLLDPILATGNSAVKAISLLIEKGVQESNIIFLNLISSPDGIHAVCKKFPMLKIVTSEIETALDEEFHVIPGMGQFGDRYFGTIEKHCKE
ncbi:hypothetical protein ACLOJK_009154 [Asimina triloba]